MPAKVRKRRKREQVDGRKIPRLRPHPDRRLRSGSPRSSPAGAGAEGRDGAASGRHRVHAGPLKQLLTRIYFPDDPGNAGDVILLLVPAERRATLVAKPRAAGEGDVMESHPRVRRDVFFDF
jgi:hypothetical protein